MQTMTVTEASKYLNITEQQLALWRCKRMRIAYLKAANGRVSYRKEDLDAYIEKHGSRNAAPVLIHPVE